MSLLSLPAGMLVAMATMGVAQATDDAAFRCQQLQGSPVPDASETVEAVWLPAGETIGKVQTAPHCKVSGLFERRTGADGKAYAIGFELRLPEQWNGKLLFQGGGGNDGIVRPALGVQGTQSPALNQGYAVVSTDGGHQGTDASFGLEEQARINHAYRAYDRVATLAKHLVESNYNRRPDHSFFIGCSGGGRQAMMFSQRFPEQFDGIIAIAPAMSVQSNATAEAIRSTQILTAIAPKDPAGHPILAQALTNSDLALVHDSILATCDADDGASDGLISRPQACSFQPQQLLCTEGGKTDCLSAEKVEALQALFAETRNTQGEKTYAAWPWDPGIGNPASDWRRWRLGTSDTGAPNARHVTLMASQEKLRVLGVARPGYVIDDFDLDRDLPIMDEGSALLYDTDGDARLQAFKDAGGKLILAHGTADPIFSAWESREYFKRLMQAHPEDGNQFAQFYLIPGMGHCQGGAATDSWDGIGALAKWVETDQPPTQINAKGSALLPTSTRPLCPYPGYARYDGKGAIEDAASFSCMQE